MQPIEEIIKEIRKQERIINEAQKSKEQLYEQLLNNDDNCFDSISVKQASRLLDVSQGLIYKKINSGELKARKIGSTIRVSKKEVLKLGEC